MSEKFVIVGAQINLFVGDIEGNAARVIEETHQAKRHHHADLVLFPELTLTGYPPEDLLFRSALYCRIHQALQKISEKIDTAVLIGYPDYIDKQYYNQAAFIEPGKINTLYSKRKLPNYHVFDEKRYFKAGTSPAIIKIKNVPLGVLICKDVWSADLIRETVQAGAQGILSINASPFAQNKELRRRQMLSEHSKTNNVPIFYLNLVGGQDELVFDGGSMVYAANGQRIQQAPYGVEHHLVTHCTTHPFTPLSNEIIPPEPSDEEQVYQSLVLGLKDYINKNHFPSALIGLSGGVDSSLTLAIAADALGPSRVHGVLMPSRYTAPMSLEDPQIQAKTLGVSTSVISIEPIFKVFIESLSQEFKHLPWDITEENLQARIRGTLLMALSNKKGALVLNTGNKSELAVGYATLYGDMVGGFAVLKDVYKTLVYRLCHYRNSISPVIPDRVLSRPPSAELAPNQTDQDTLPTYALLDAVLERYIEKDQDIATIIAAGFEPEIVKKIALKVQRSEYKRRQSPIGVRITERAFGKDWRYPITSRFLKN